MKAIVVYESHWGNTAAIAQAIAEGLGPGAQALTTSQAVSQAISGADLIVAGAPVLGFSLPTEAMIESLSKEAVKPDLSNPSMRDWLDGLPKGNGRSAAFETRIWWSPGGATKAIQRVLEEAGYPAIADAQRFIVKDRYGPLKEGELERAKQWGAELAQAMA
jgi:flavodoxin